MFSQIFVLSSRGDTLVFKDCKLEDICHFYEPSSMVLPFTWRGMSDLCSVSNLCSFSLK